MNIESQLQTEFLLLAPERLPDYRFFRRNIGSAKMPDGFKVKFGIKGQCDLYAMKKGGQHFEIELKAAGNKIKPESDQDKWRAWCLEWSIPHIVLTGANGESFRETAERWCREFLLLSTPVARLES